MPRQFVSDSLPVRTREWTDAQSDFGGRGSFGIEDGVIRPPPEGALSGCDDRRQLRSFRVFHTSLTAKPVSLSLAVGVISPDPGLREDSVTNGRA
jgi:hypothetical protein